MVTMSDVAREAGVSVMTVSNVLNERLPVGEPTRARVLAAVEALGYEVNLTARHLRAGRTDTVALIVPSFHDYFGEVADKIAPLVEAQGRHLVLERTSASPEHEMEARERRAAPALRRRPALRGRARPRPAEPRADVQADRAAGGAGRARPLRPRAARERGGRAARHRAHDRARFAPHPRAGLHARPDPHDDLGPPRRAGRRAHRDAGLPVDERYVVPIATYSSRQPPAPPSSTSSRPGLPFDGVFAATDVIALGAVAALADRGLRVPDDVQLAGFDNLEVSSFVPPGITSVDPNHRGVAQHAVGLLHRRMAGNDGPAEHVVAPVSLVVRGSTRGGR